MNLPVRDLLSRRTADLTAGRKVASLVASLAVHVFIVVLVIVTPLLSADEEELPEYVAVQIIPARMLGTSTPTPAAPRPQERQVEAVEPEPEPERVEVPTPEETPVRPSVPDPAPTRSAAASARKVETRESTPGALAQREGSPTGSRLGTSNFGADVGFDNPDFTYDYYVDRMLARIREYWVRPSLGGSVEAMIRFRIKRSGEVTDVAIARSSGYNSFDLAAMRAVQSSSPLPPLPQTFKHDSLGVNLVVR